MSLGWLSKFHSSQHFVSFFHSFLWNCWKALNRQSDVPFPPFPLPRSIQLCHIRPKNLSQPTNPLGTACWCLLLLPFFSSTVLTPIFPLSLTRWHHQWGSYCWLPLQIVLSPLFPSFSSKAAALSFIPVKMIQYVQDWKYCTLCLSDKQGFTDYIFKKCTEKKLFRIFSQMMAGPIRRC